MWGVGSAVWGLRCGVWGVADIYYYTHTVFPIRALINSWVINIRHRPWAKHPHCKTCRVAGRYAHEQLAGPHNRPSIWASFSLLILEVP